MQETSCRLGRRAFVLGSAALAVCTQLPAFAAIADATRLFLCDRRHLARLSAAERSGLLAVFDGDLTRVWLEQVQPMWSDGPAVIAGIASPAGLFCLEQLARGERHRLVARTALSSSAVSFRFAPVGARVLA
jgi:hypothetical protein